MTNVQDELDEDLRSMLLRDSSDKVKAQFRGPTHDLQRVITFPYSRHSSYPELCDFVHLFEPMDVWPCTVNLSDWHENSKPYDALREYIHDN